MATDDNTPATKRDLLDLEERLNERLDQRLDQRLGHMQSELQEQMRVTHAQIQEQMRDMQTELLRAFLPWQEAVHTQFGELDLNTTNSVKSVKERMNILERRLLQIERKLLLEPPAA